VKTKKSTYTEYAVVTDGRTFPMVGDLRTADYESALNQMYRLHADGYSARIIKRNVSYWRDLEHGTT
jgi:hypothetical protein